LSKYCRICRHRLRIVCQIFRIIGCVGDVLLVIVVDFWLWWRGGGFMKLFIFTVNCWLTRPYKPKCCRGGFTNYL
jgi:hypothetical protein